MDKHQLKKMANVLVKGGATREQLWMWLKSSNGVMDDAVLEVICMEALSSKHRNVRQMVEIYIGTTQEWFYMKDMVQELGITQDERGAVRTALYTLTQEGTLEHDKSKDGKYRLKNHKLDLIDWKSAEVGNVYELMLPFKIHDLVTIYPQNVLMFSGEKNTGKTSIANAIVKHNMARYDIRTLISEAAGEEIKARRLAHKDVGLDDWKDEVVSCSRHYADKIKPGAVNVVDYLEIAGGEFYRIVDEIRDIYEAVGNGLAIIFLQKSDKSEYGTGGRFSVEKARLVCNLSRGAPNTCFLQTVKNWKGDRNPNGLKIKYQVINDGANLVEKGREWFGVNDISSKESIQNFNKEISSDKSA